MGRAPALLASVSSPPASAWAPRRTACPAARPQQAGKQARALPPEGKVDAALVQSQHDRPHQLRAEPVEPASSGAGSQDMGSCPTRRSWGGLPSGLPSGAPVPQSQPAPTPATCPLEERVVVVASGSRGEVHVLPGTTPVLGRTAARPAAARGETGRQARGWSGAGHGQCSTRSGCARTPAGARLRAPCHAPGCSRLRRATAAVALLFLALIQRLVEGGQALAQAGAGAGGRRRRGGARHQLHSIAHLAACTGRQGQQPGARWAVCAPPGPACSCTQLQRCRRRVPGRA